MTESTGHRLSFVEIIAILALAGIVAVIFFPDTKERTPEALTRMRLEALAGAIKDYYRFNGVLPSVDPTGRWVYNLHRSGDVIPPYILNMPEDYFSLDKNSKTGQIFDSEGRAVIYRADATGFMVISQGADDRQIVITSSLN